MTYAVEKCGVGAAEIRTTSPKCGQSDMPPTAPRPQPRQHLGRGPRCQNTHQRAINGLEREGCSGTQGSKANQRNGSPDKRVEAQDHELAGYRHAPQQLPRSVDEDPVFS